MSVGGFLTAQTVENINIRYDENTIFDEKISEKEKTKIIASISKMVNDYNSKANLKDYNKVTGNVTESSISEFKNLFIGDGSEVFDDISAKPSIIKLSEYIDLIYQNMNEIGVRFEITDAYLASIQYNEAGFYNAEVKINKLMLNGINKKNQEKELKKPELKQITLSIDIKKNYSALIYKIIGKVDAIKKSKENELLVSARYGISLPKISLESNKFSDATTNSNFSFKSNYILSLGGEYRFTLKEKNKLKPKIGLYISVSQFQLQSENGFTSINSYSPNALLEEKVYIENGSKFNFNFLGVDIPMGVFYRLYNNYHNSSSIDIEGSILNHIVVSNEGRFIGNATYIIDQKNKSSDGSYVCNDSKRDLDNIFNYKSASYNLGIRLGLTFQKDLVYDKIRWYISGDYTYFTNPLLDIKSSGYIDKLNINNSQVNQNNIAYNVFLPKITAHQIGISVGVLFKIKN